MLFAKKVIGNKYGAAMRDVKVKHVDIIPEHISEIISHALPEDCYYVVVKCEDMQKPYFIWTCHPNNNRIFLEALVNAIRHISKIWIDEIIPLSAFHLYEIPNVIEDYSTYHLVVDGYYHANGNVAQQFIEEVCKCFNTDIAIECNKRNLDRARYVLYHGYDKQERLHYNINSDCVIYHMISDPKVAIITYVHGKELIKKEPEPGYIYSWYSWLLGWTYYWIMPNSR